jgi:xanthine/CO dehydrogenase XdhC/CoxF family maturation factor
MIKTPIGLEINALTPGEIAIAIAAEIVDTKNTIIQE